MRTNIPNLTPEEIENHPFVLEAIARGFIELKRGRVYYNLNQKRDYEWSDPEEWVRCFTISHLITEKGYPPNRMRTEVAVPRRIPEDSADIVVFEEDRCFTPYLVVENKANGQSESNRLQGIEQLFGNTNSLRAPLALYDEYWTSTFYDVGNYPSTERNSNIKGTRDAIPPQYGNIPEYTYIAGPDQIDIKPAKQKTLESKVRRAHSIIWSGGKRDPLTAFDEWSKLLFAKVEDERNTPNGEARKFQVGTNETHTAVANRVHKLFEQACKADPSIFSEEVRIQIPDKKIFEVVKVLQDISITDTTVDSIGAAFESFFGSVFRGELGQYFTMRQLARFTVAMLDINQDDYVIDPTAGSGGFLLEVLLQVWNMLDKRFAGRNDLDRIKLDFALHKVYGVEIHEILARICKINLLLHHDGHTNIEGDRSCLDTVFLRPRLTHFHGKFTKIVGNPPFGDSVEEGDEDLLGENSLSSFTVAAGRRQVPSEHAILERAIDMLSEGGRLGFILPDGLFNNQGELSNCPRIRKFLVENGVIQAIISLPDFAFRKSGAQNKTSILFFRKFTAAERIRFNNTISNEIANGASEENALERGLRVLNYSVFLAEARYTGYTPTGISTELNDLYNGSAGGQIYEDQTGTILGEYKKFLSNPSAYKGALQPDCISIPIVDMWTAHESHRLDPKYHLFKHESRNHLPDGWIVLKISDVMKRREEIVRPELNPDDSVMVMTLSQTGDIRPREAGKGNNPPDWLGMYFEDSSSTWFKAHKGDVVFSSIDLWKGCISVVPEEFDGAIVTKEFPIYQITDNRLTPEFLSTLLRSRYYQRAFRAITTGHSNRRRTQVSDFEALEIIFPPNPDEQFELIKDVVTARASQRAASDVLKTAMLSFSNLIDGRGDEEIVGLHGDDDDSDGNK
ncbi:N-6 DNA methylase [Brevibacillus parabrevis]|uniref:N-6 DNA methylase n=1 Tax=Brevibacillus parabrevis TaxID=54914 RepID=UPI0028D3390E|nr:N-6 DNA methylase [Brevibacillus parabrevis]